MNKEVMERVVISVTPDIGKANRGVRRNSEGKRDTKTSPGLSTGDEKLLPHYLRASTGSCHDFCKYGRKHAFEAKERHPTCRMSLGNNGIPNEEYVKVMSIGERRKRSVSKPTTFQTKAVMSDELKSFEKKVLSHANKTEGFSGDLISPKSRTISPVNRSIESTEHTSDQAEEISDEPFSIKLVMPSPNERSIISDGNKSSSQAGGSSEEPVCIKLVTPLPIEKSFSSDGNTSSSHAGLFEELINLKLETPSTIKENINFPDSDSAILAEGSLEELESMNIQTSAPDERTISSADVTPINGAEKSPEEPVIFEVTSLPSIQKAIASAEVTPTDGEERSSEGSMSMELEIPPSIQNSSGDLELVPASHAEESSRERLSVKVKTPSTTKGTVASGKPLGTKQNIPLCIKKNTASSEHTVTQTQNEQDKLNSSNMGERRKKRAAKLKSTIPPKTDEPKVLKLKEGGASQKPDITLQRTQSHVKKNTPPKLIKQKSLTSFKKIISYAKPKIIKERTSSPLKEKDVFRRPSISLKPKTSVVKSKSPLASSGGLTGRSKEKNGVSSSVRMPKFGEEKALKPLRTSLSPKPFASVVSNTKLRKGRNIKLASPFKSQENVGKVEEINEIVKEKTLYVVSLNPVKKGSKSMMQKPENDKSLSSRTLSATSKLLSSPSGSSHDEEELEDSESTCTEVSESLGADGMKDKKQVDYAKGEDKRRSRRTVSVHPEAEMPKPHKLKFRRGRVVNPQAENNGPRRLRFRQARVVSQNHNGKEEVEKRSFRRKELAVADPNKPTLEAPAVVLRHQDQQEKKDSQSLFNHVIEETASKLVETRKSKVKALVGAFETVISLQETTV